MGMFSPNMSPTNMSKMNFINAKKDISGKLEFNGNYFLSDTLALKAEGFFPSDDVANAHI